MEKTIVEGFRLSPQQEHLWWLQQGHSDMSARASCTVRITGPVNPSTLENAVAKTISRHEILRTTFQRLQGMTMPLQVVSESSQARVQRYDLTELQPAHQVARRTELLANSYLPASFDEADPLHLALITTSPDEHTLLINLPAMCSDVVGLKNFVFELGRSYAASLDDDELSDEPMQYPDFSEWQNEILSSAESETGRAHWQQDREAVEAELILPLENPSFGVQDFKPRFVSYPLALSTVEKIERLSALHESSLATSLLGTFFALLARLTASAQLSLGVFFDGRNYDELASALGLFGRFLPVRADLSSGLQFPQLLAGLDASLADARRWQEFYTYSTAASTALASGAPGLDHSPAPFFPICFEFVDDAAPSVRVTDSLHFTLLQSSVYISRFKVLLRCLRQSDGSLVAEWHYDATRYDEAEVERLAQRWVAALESISAQEGAVRVAEVEVIGAGERTELLQQGRGSKETWGGEKCVHEIFAAQAARTPEAIALVYEGESLTYGELNKRTNQLAGYLRRKGVKAEERVGLMMERSIAMVVGMLGIMKAGGAYVPLERSQPSERLARMVKDAGVQVVVSVEELREEVVALRAAGGLEVELYLDSEGDAIERESGEAIGAVASEENIAYVIYTSGSTGAPKGVMICHKAICNRLLWMLKKFPITAADRVLQKTPFNFDASIWEIFVPLFAGACLVMARPEGHQDSAYLVSKIAESEITILQLVPSMLRIVLEEPGFEDCKSLRLVFCGGEALSANIQKQFFARLNLELHNLYGPTETAIDATSWTFRADDQSRAVIIGRPIANTEIYLLDSHLNLVPLGVGGELHIGGVNLARGYLNQAELTAERFIPNPFSSKPGERLYKTGDLARQFEDGAIEYLGRIDHQVKLRGFRIELGEIEAVLGRHPQVRQAVVTVREDEAEHKRLVAYVVAPSEPELTVSELHSYLKVLLPEYMVPSAFVFLTELPLLPNGKMDRKSLPAPEQVRPELDHDYVGPRTATEEQLARIWREVLGVEQVGMEDNFFELGGDSILSIQIVARANQAGLKLSPKHIFRHQSIGELSAAIAEARAGAGEGMIDAEQGLLRGEVPLTPIQRYFFAQSLSEQEHFNQSLMLLVRRRIDGERLQAVVRAVVEQHDGLRLRFGETGAGWEQRYGGEEAVSEVVVQEVDVSEVSGAEQRGRITAASDAVQRSLKLEGGGLLRVVLFETGAEQRLLLVAHHLVVDGVSWRVLVEDLGRGLEQAERGEAIELGRKTSSYRRWAERLEEYAGGAAAVGEQEYWNQVAKWSGGKLPVDFPDGQNTIELSSSVVQWLDVEATHALLQEVPKAYRTQINDVLLTALVEAVGKWSGQRQVLVDMEGHGRSDELFEDIDLLRTVGWFTSVYPVLLNLEGIDDLGSSLKHVKEHLRNIPHGGIGYGILRYLNAADDAEENSKKIIDAEVSFNYLGQMDHVLDENSLFAAAPEAQGTLQSERGQRRYLLEITMAVSDGRLQVQWTYGVQFHARETIERVAKEYTEALRRLIAHCQSNDTQGLNASDFSLVQLDNNELDQILSEVEFAGT